MENKIILHLSIALDIVLGENSFKNTLRFFSFSFGIRNWDPSKTPLDTSLILIMFLPAELTMRGYGFLPNENISQSSIPKLQTSDFDENTWINRLTMSNFTVTFSFVSSNDYDLGEVIRFHYDEIKKQHGSAPKFDQATLGKWLFPQSLNYWSIYALQILGFT